MERLRNSVELVPRFRRRNEETISLYKYSLGSASRKKKKFGVKEDLGNNGEQYVKEKVSLSEKSALKLARKAMS